MAKKKNILLVVGSLGMGGIEKLVVDYSDALSKDEYQFSYLIFDGKGGCFEKKVLDNGSKIITIQSPQNRLSFYKNLRAVMRKYGPFDIVHSHILFSSGIVMRAAYKESVKMRIAHSHDNLAYVETAVPVKIYYSLMRYFLRKYTTKRVACSRDAGEYLFGKNFIRRGGIILKNRIDVDKFAYSNYERDTVRRLLGFKGDQLVVGTIGRIEKQKNQKFIVDMMEAGEIRNLNIKAVIIGDGEERRDLLNYIDNKDQKNNVLFLGQKDNVARYLSAFDVFVLPSIHEGLGIVLIEAQANGLPCIAPKGIVPNEVEILKSFEFVSLEKRNDPNEWIDRIIKAKREDPKVSIKAVKKYGYDVSGLKFDLLKLYADGGQE